MESYLAHQKKTCRKVFIVRFHSSHVPRDVMPFIGREKELNIFQDIISETSNGCVAVYGGPGIGKSRLLTKFEEKALEKGFNAIFYSPNEHHDELSFLYQMGISLQKILIQENSQSRLHESFLQKSRLKRKKVESIFLGTGSIIGGAVIHPTVGVGLTLISILMELRGSNIQNIEHIAILIELLLDDLKELAEKNQKTIIMLDDCHKLQNFEAFQDLIMFVSQKIPDNIYIIVASRRRFRELTGAEIELLEFSENELREACQLAFPYSNVAELKEASFGHPYIIDRLFSIKKIPKHSFKDRGVEAAMDYVDTSYMLSLSKEESEFLKKISPIEDITYESAAAVGQESPIFTRKLMLELISRSMLSFVGRRDILTRERIYKLHDIFQAELYRYLDNPAEIHKILADFYSAKMRAVTFPSQKLYYLRLSLHHLQESSPEEFVRLVRKTVEMGGIFDILGRYEESLRLITEALNLCKDMEVESYLTLFKGYYQEMLGNTEDARNTYQEAIDKFTEIKNDDGLADSLHQKANVLETEGQYELAESYYKESMVISERIGDIIGYSESIHQLGMLSSNRGEYTRAIEYLDKSIQLGRETGDTIGEIMSAELKVEVLRQMGLYDEAENLVNQALTMSRENEYLEGEAYALNVLADIDLEKGNYAKSFECNQISEEIYRENRDVVGILMCQLTKGKILERLGEYAGALKVLEDALMYSKSIRDIRRESVALRWIGIIFLREGNLEDAGRYFAESFSISEKLGDMPGIAMSLQCQGILSLEEGDSNDAMEKFKESLKVSRSLGENPSIVDSLYWIGRVYEKEGNKKALRIFQKCLRFYREIGNRRGLADSIFMIGVIYRKAGFLSSSLRKMGLALKMYREMGCKLNIAEALVEVARIEKEMGENTEALKLLQEALELAEELGNRKLKEKVLQEILL